MRNGPIVAHVHNVLSSRQTVFVADRPMALVDLKPKVNLPTLCQVNGEYVLPEDWHLPAGHLDHVIFYTVPQGGGDSNPLVTLLSIVLMTVGFFTDNIYLFAAGAALLVSGLLPAPSFTPLSANAESASPTYSISLSGNTSRLGSTIPVPYGRHVIIPDFASQPYSEYDEAGDQFYHALLCLGQQERHTIEQINIDDTVISHFEGVQTQLIGPQYTGVTLSLVDPCVVNAPEVANQDLLSGTYVGPFSVCGPGLTTSKISIDIICQKGLYLANDAGDLGPKSISWIVEVRTITNTGASSEPWVILGAETLTESTNKTIRRSYTYTLGSGRYEVRIQRTDTRVDNIRAGHDMSWGGLRAYVNKAAPLEPSAVFLAIRIKANNQLSGLSQRKITVVQRRWLKTWHPMTGWSADYVDTQSIAWAAADVLRNTVYGGKLPDNRIDLQSLYELDQVWSSRGDTFNGIFDKRVTVWAALSSVLRAGRASPIMRGSVFTFVRDTQQDLPVALFSMHNIRRGSFQIDYSLPSENDTDGLELEYFSSDTWAPAYVTIPVPGVSTPVNVAKASLMGITSSGQATREATHIVNDAFYRKSRITFDTEMEGFLPSFGDLIAVSHDVTGWGSSGEITFWSSPEAICSEEIVFKSGQHYVMLADDQGDVHGPYMVVPGSKENSIRFLELPDFTPNTDTEKLRTRYAFGPSTSYAKYCKLLSAQPKDGNIVTIVAVVEDVRVHSDSNYVGLPGGGTALTGRLGRYAPAGIPNYNAASDAQHNAYGFVSKPDRTVGTAGDNAYVYTS